MADDDRNDTRGLAGQRLFAVYAVASLLPIVALGATLSWLLSLQADRNGLAEARQQAGITAVSLSPLLASADLVHDLTPGQRLVLNRTSEFAASQGQFLRASVYSPDGHTVFRSDDPSLVHEEQAAGPIRDEVRRALSGEVLAQLSRMDADEGGGGARVVEVYQPIRATASSPPVGVVELYLPYEPIAAHAAAGQRLINRVLVGGLAALWLVLTAISVSVTRRLQRQVRATSYLAAHDPLTSLPNRASFRDLTAGILAEQPAGTAIAVMDLDRFREVNDALGHRNGDELLEKLAARLRAAVRPDDTVARLGGNEFGLILRDVEDPVEAAETLQRLRGVVSAGITVGGLPLTVEASVGYALHPADSPDIVGDADTLLRFADIAMSTAKRRHLGLARYDEADNPHDGAALTLMGELQRAVAADELVLHYQPKVHVPTGQVEGVEALVRWQHPELGLLFPDAFIPAVEQTELMELLTSWVIGRALEDLGWIDPSGTLLVAVNVSARSLARPDFAATVLDLLAQRGVEPCRMLLEMTETALLVDPERVADALGELSRAGVGISIDDFGAGQTSLGYLATLPVDEVKIDKSFVLDMAHNPRSAAIVRSVVELAHSLGFTVTAEGVETADSLTELRTMGCDAAQGYLLSRPAPLERLPAALRDAARLAAVPVAN